MRRKVHHPIGELKIVPKLRPGDFPVGSLESRAAARGLLLSRETKSVAEDLSEFGDRRPHLELMLENQEPLTRSYIIRIARSTAERAKIYGYSDEWPSLEDMRARRAKINSTES